VTANTQKHNTCTPISEKKKEKEKNIYIKYNKKFKSIFKV